MNIRLLLSFTIVCLALGSSGQNNTSSLLISGIDHTLKKSQPAINQATCDTFFSFQTLDPWPTGVVYDGNILFCNGNDSGFIYKYDLAGQVLGRIPNPGINSFKGGDIDFDGIDLWTVVEQDAKIYKLDRFSGTVLAQFVLPGGSTDYFGCAYDNGFIWTSEYTIKKLCKIDALTGALVSNIPLNRVLLGMKIINGDLWALDWPNGMVTNTQLVKLDKSTGLGLDSIPWCLGYPTGFCTAQNHFWGVSSRAAVNNGKQRIYQFDSLFPTLNIIENNLTGFSVYPNPFEQTTTIHLDRYYEKVIFELKDLLGKSIEKRIFSGENLPLENMQYPPGMYFIQVTFDNKLHSKKILIH